jgi:hypothetical protein
MVMPPGSIHGNIYVHCVSVPAVYGGKPIILIWRIVNENCSEKDCFMG